MLFAGCTVVISLLGMLLLGLPFVYGLAFGAIAAVLLVMAGSLTLLPALLGFAGQAIDRLHVPDLLHRRPKAAPGVVLVPLEPASSSAARGSRRSSPSPSSLVLAIPLLLACRLAFTDAGNDPTTLTTRQAYDLLAKGFGPGANGPLVVAVDAPGRSAGRRWPPR